MQNKLAADPSALVLGIISLVILFVGCCCGLLFPVALILSIIGLVQANKSIREYYANAEAFSRQSYSNVNTARVICIIGVVISSIFTLIIGVYFAIVGTLASNEILKKFREGRHDFTETEMVTDTVYQDSTIIMESHNAESDTIHFETKTTN